jgi:GxxExxY protein
MEVPCGVAYKGHELRGHYHMDFVCYSTVVVEVKARSGVGPADRAQVINYLAATGLRTALLLNFGAQRLDYKRFVLGNSEANP